MAKYPPIPRVRRPAMLQSWLDLTFLHWRCPISAIAAQLPRGLQPDTFDGSAWVGITPFRVAGLRPPFAPAVPWLSHFPETNCRTYVRGPDGTGGIWFFSLDCARLLAVAGARASYGLPYAWSRMRIVRSRGRVEYRSARRWPDRFAGTHFEIDRAEDFDPGELEIFLTARYRLYTMLLGRLAYADVEHPPWPLERATVLAWQESLIAAAGLPELDGPPLAWFSPGVHTRIGAPRFARG